MERLDLVPELHRAERLLLLDTMAGQPRDLAVDADAFLAIAPPKLHPFLHLQLRDRTLPDRVRETLAAAYRRSALKELRRALDLKRVDTALRAASIPFLVLKGPVLAATVYPDRASRTMTDLDFLLDERDLGHATEVLAAAGFRMPLQFAGAEIGPGDLAPLIHDEPGGPSIELHTMLDSLPDDRSAFATSLGDSRTVPYAHGVELRALGRGEFFAHVVIHVSKHHRFERELRSLLDVALLLRAEHDLDWSAHVQAWEKRAIVDWIALTVRLANLLLAAPIPAALAARPVSSEALALAAEQLWIVDRAVPPRIAQLVAGGGLSPIHANVRGQRAPVPSGLDGVRARLARGVEVAGRFFKAGAEGGFRPRTLSRDVELFRKRERLFAVVEKTSPAD